MHGSKIPIWFFVGILLTVYGAMIFGYGLVEVFTGQTAPVVLANLHAPIWWGGTMFALGLFYGVRFRPGRNG
jgi:hypothetical protein